MSKEEKEFDEMVDEMVRISNIAMICHEANRSLCKTLNDHSQVYWDEAPQWQKDSAIDGVKFNLDNPSAPASASHDNWLAEKEAAGWKYGETKDEEKKEHPCFVPFAQLSKEQQAKDHLFKAIVGALRSTVRPAERYIKLSVLEANGTTAIYINKEGVGYMEELGLYQYAVAVTMQATLVPITTEHQSHCPHHKAESDG